MGFSALGVLFNIIQQEYDLTFRQMDLFRQKRNMTNVAMAASRLSFMRQMQQIQGGGTGTDNRAEQQEIEFQNFRNQKVVSLVESEIDQELEDIKARLTALKAQKEDIQRQVKDNIQFTFKNAYA